jgi:hypothetical protein
LDLSLRHGCQSRVVWQSDGHAGRIHGDTGDFQSAFSSRRGDTIGCSQSSQTGRRFRLTSRSRSWLMVQGRELAFGAGGVLPFGAVALRAAHTNAAEHLDQRRPKFRQQGRQSIAQPCDSSLESLAKKDRVPLGTADSRH